MKCSPTCVPKVSRSSSMLADSSYISGQSGTLANDVHLQATSLYALIDFIANELPHWRDREDRKHETSETALTSQLCAHMNSASRRCNGWDFLQFRIEEPDEKNVSRKIDLVPAPCATTVWIDGRRHVDFDPLLPIECKRLPTPPGKDRDEREYVFSKHATTGGIQRFKEGHHGALHSVGAMIAYLQENTPSHWSTCVCQWIKDLVESRQLAWAETDVLRLERNDDAQGLTVFRSSHARVKGLPDIEMRHLWIQMN